VVVAVPSQDAPEPEGADTGDEQTFAMPSTWRRAVHPYRGRVARPVRPADPGAIGTAAKLVRESAADLERALSHSANDRRLTEGARAYLDGAPDPVGAAVVAAVVAMGWRTDLAPFADSWAAQHGPTFAALALAAFFDMAANNDAHSAGVALWRAPAGSIRAGHRGRAMADRVRELLAVADDAAYQATVAQVQPWRGCGANGALACYLLPTEQQWVDEYCAEQAQSGHSDPQARAMILCSVRSTDQLAALGWRFGQTYYGFGLDVIATLADAFGPAIAPLLASELRPDERAADVVRLCANALAELPTDEAFAALLAQAGNKYVRPAVQTAARRHPRRALRMLAEAAVRAGSAASKSDAMTRQLLAAHVAAHPDLAAELLPALREDAAALVFPLLDRSALLPDADPAALPAVLADPPWLRRTRAKPVQIPGLEAPARPATAWEPGEREEWLQAVHGGWLLQDPRMLAAEVAKLAAGEDLGRDAARVFALGPQELVRPLLADWEPDEFWYVADQYRTIIAKYELDALPAALRAASARPADLGHLLAPFRTVEVARLMADWLVRLKTAGSLARSWLARHGADAAAALIPDALGKPGTSRRAAEQALRQIVAHHGRETVLDAAAAYGDAVRDAIGSVLAADPVQTALPARLPAAGDWVQPALLPQIRVRAGGAVPAAGAGHLITLLALSRPGESFPGLDEVRDGCDPADLAGWAWELFQQWRVGAMPAKDSWALHALGLLGDDETARRITPVVRAWPGEGAHQRAVDGLDVLAAIGTDTALLQLHGIAQRVPFKALKTRAQAKIAEVAAGLGLTGEQLGDRLVPDFGLGADGTTVIDYGTRRFTVGFDEHLKPYVLDEDGKWRKDLPAPGARDDADLAPAERKRFAGIKKDVRTVAVDQLRRLENAMVVQRTWSFAEFRSLFVEHPLVWHLARRLLWIAETPAGRTAFRVAEDRTLADLADDALTLPEDAVIRIAHPILLGAETAAWCDVFADYEILQPFPQLHREVIRLTGPEAAGNELTRFTAISVPTTRFLGLVPRGWDRGQPQDAGVECWMSRRLAPDLYVVLALEHGIAVGMPTEVFENQAVEKVWLDTAPSYGPRPGSRLRFGDLDPVTASEILSDLTWLTAR
jgi:Domain of unknown function (DUF4132)